MGTSNLGRLVQFQQNDLWELVPWPTDTNTIRTRWKFKSQSVERVDFEETFALEARLESITLLLSISCQMVNFIRRTLRVSFLMEF